MPLFDCGVKSTVPVTISGCWNSSPSFFQYSTLAKIGSKLARLFSSRTRSRRGRLGAPRLNGAVAGRIDRLAPGGVVVSGLSAGLSLRAIGRRLGAGGASLFISWAISASGSTSASMTRRPERVRSWLRSRRTVSRLASTSSEPPAMKPTTWTRWNGDTSSFAWIGVSIGIS